MEREDSSHSAEILFFLRKYMAGSPTGNEAWGEPQGRREKGERTAPNPQDEKIELLREAG